MTFGGSEWARIGADKPPPPEARPPSPEATVEVGGEARDGGDGGGGSGGSAPRLRLLPQTSEDTAAAAPAADAAAAVTPSGVAGTPALASGVAVAAGVAATSANGDKPAAPPPPWEGAPATAALFADFLSYRSPRVDGQSRGASEHKAAVTAAAYPAVETGGPVAAQAIHLPPCRTEAHPCPTVQPHPCPGPLDLKPRPRPRCNTTATLPLFFTHICVCPSTNAGHLLKRRVRGQARPAARPPSRPELAGATPAAASGGRRTTRRAGPGPNSASAKVVECAHLNRV